MIFAENKRNSRNEKKRKQKQKKKKKKKISIDGKEITINNKNKKT